MSRTSKFSKQEAIRFGWETVTKNLSFFIPLLILMFVLNAVPSIIANAFAHEAPLLSFLLNIVRWIIQMLVSLGLVIIALKFVDKQKPSYSDLWEHYSLLPQYIIASILYVIMIGTGLILFIIPGIYLALTYGFFSYLIVDKKMSALDAIKKSAELTKGVKIDLGFLILLFAGIALLGLLALVVGLFVAVPVIMLAQAYVYRKLSS